MRSQIKKDIHLGHVGVEGCLRRARESVYWPGMNGEIKEYIQTCETCREFECSQTKETLMNHEVPDRRWKKVGVDLFSYHEKDYLVTTEDISNFWEIYCLDSNHSSLESSSGRKRKFEQDWMIDHNMIFHPVLLVFHHYPQLHIMRLRIVMEQCTGVTVYTQGRRMNHHLMW